MRDVGIRRVVGVADRRPDHPAIGVDLFRDEIRAIIGLGEKAAELLLRIVDDDGNEDLALVGGDDRPVVGDALGEAGSRRR
jgi:hypothetical protein